MYDWQSFEVVFHGKADYAYESKTVSTILKHREELGGTLFFDRVWSTLGLKAGMLGRASIWSGALLLATRCHYRIHEVAAADPF